MSANRDVSSATALFALRLFVSEIISLLFAPAQDSCLVEQSVLLHFFLVDPLPLRDTRLSGSIRPAAAHHSILQNSRRMRKQPLILFTFCAAVKAYLRLMNCGFPGEPWGYSMHESSERFAIRMPSGEGKQDASGP